MEEKTLEDLETKIGKLLKHQPLPTIASMSLKISISCQGKETTPIGLKRQMLLEQKSKRSLGQLGGGVVFPLQNVMMIM